MALTLICIYTYELTSMLWYLYRVPHGALFSWHNLRKLPVAYLPRYMHAHGVHVMS